MRKRRIVARFLLTCLLLCGGCAWLQNEFFSLDRAAPAQKPDASTKPPW